MSDSSLRQLDSSEPVVEVKLPKDQVLQKYLARKIGHELELSFLLVTGEEEVGFVTGFDEDGWFQLTSGELDEKNRNRDILIQGSAVVLVEETGKCLRDMSILTQTRVRDYSYALIQQCKRSIRRPSTRTSYTDEEEKEELQSVGA